MRSKNLCAICILAIIVFSGEAVSNAQTIDLLPIKRVAPVYPERALSRGIEGFVLLEFTVNKSGAVVSPVVIDSSPKGLFDQAAIRAVLKFEYQPRTVDELPIAVEGVRTRITFKLEDSGPVYYDPGSTNIDTATLSNSINGWSWYTPMVQILRRYGKEKTEVKWRGNALTIRVSEPVTILDSTATWTYESYPCDRSDANNCPLTSASASFSLRKEERTRREYMKAFKYMEKLLTVKFGPSDDTRKDSRSEQSDRTVGESAIDHYSSSKSQFLTFFSPKAVKFEQLVTAFYGGDVRDDHVKWDGERYRTATIQAAKSTFGIQYSEFLDPSVQAQAPSQLSSGTQSKSGGSRNSASNSRISTECIAHSKREVLTGYEIRVTNNCSETLNASACAIMPARKFDKATGFVNLAPGDSKPIDFFEPDKGGFDYRIAVCPPMGKPCNVQCPSITEQGQRKTAPSRPSGQPESCPSQAKVNGKYFPILAQIMNRSAGNMASTCKNHAHTSEVMLRMLEECAALEPEWARRNKSYIADNRHQTADAAQSGRDCYLDATGKRLEPLRF